MKECSTMHLTNPTRGTIADYVEAFDSENRLVEKSLRLLFEAYPKNSDERHILLKVTTLNKLYSTNIYDVEALTRHIVSRADLDLLLARGDPEAVEHITIGEGLKKNYSFAMKYCSWHQPTLFPIFDTLAELCLCAYTKHDGFASWKGDDLRDYRRFLEVLEAFREFYRLDVSHKDLDKFLYLRGRELQEERKKAKAAKA